MDSNEIAMMDSIRERAERAENQRDMLMTALADWVLSKRPDGWTEDQHSKAPRMRCSGGKEERIVEAYFAVLGVKP